MYPRSCQGALSYSPGSILTVPYKEVIHLLGDTPAWCLYGTGDTDSADTCDSVAGENYYPIHWPSDDHGIMTLIKPGVQPCVLQTLVDAIVIAFGLE